MGKTCKRSVQGKKVKIDMILIACFIGLFLIIGVFLINGKGAFLLAGYNVMPKEEKANYDEIALCKFTGKMMFALSFSMIFWLLSDYYTVNWLFYIGLVMFLGLIAFMLIYMNTGKRFKKE